MTFWEFDSAHAKSSSLPMMTLSSSALARTSDFGAAPYFGERQIQSQSPESGSEPEVSRKHLMPCLCILLVSGFMS